LPPFLDFLLQPWLDYNFVPRVQPYNEKFLQISCMLFDMELEWGIKEQVQTESANPWLVSDSATLLSSPSDAFRVEAGPGRIAAATRGGEMSAEHAGVKVKTQIWGVTAMSIAERPGALQTATLFQAPTTASLEGVVSVRRTPYLRVATNFYGDRTAALAVDTALVFGGYKLALLAAPGLLGPSPAPQPTW
jgi:hypothetical protein